MFQLFDSIFGIVAMFVIQNVILNIGFGFCVFNSIWEHRLNYFPTPQIEKKRHLGNRTFSQKCEQISYGTFGGIFLGFLVTESMLAMSALFPRTLEL